MERQKEVAIGDVSIEVEGIETFLWMLLCSLILSCIFMVYAVMVLASRDRYNLCIGDKSATREHARGFSLRSLLGNYILSCIFMV